MRLSSPSTSVVNRVCCSPCPFLHPWKSTPKTAQILTASWYTYEFSWFSIPLHNQTLVAPYVTTILLKKHITDVTRFNINTLAQKSLSHSLFLSYQLPFFLLHTSTLLSFQTDWTSSLKAESSRTTSLLFPLHHSWDTTSSTYFKYPFPRRFSLKGNMNCTYGPWYSFTWTKAVFPLEKSSRFISLRISMMTS